MLRPCLLFSIKEIGRCGTVQVYENRARGSGRRIALRVVVLPARGVPVSPDPVVFLTGGPGLAAAEEPDVAAHLLSAVRDGHDIVLVDQRGTGQSNPLPCDLYDDRSLQSYLDPMFPSERVRACRSVLERRADLTQYTTEIAADDLADVLTALGYGRVNLFGVSYGTRASLVFLRRHPDRVRTATLLSVFPPDKVLGLANARAGARALAAAFIWCASDAACHAAVPDPAGDLRTVQARLAATPASLTLWNWRRLRLERVSITRHDVDEFLWSILYLPSRGRRALLLVHRAAAGDWAPLARTMIDYNRIIRSGRSRGMTFSVLCTEDASRMAAEDTASVAGASPLGVPVLGALLAACAIWPRGVLASADTMPVRSTVPVLLLSGALDPATPVEWADSAAAGLPNSRSVVNPTGGHAALYPDGVRLIGEFVRKGR